MTHIFKTLLCGLLVCFTSYTQAKNIDTENEINIVIAQFKEAIENKDKQGFLDLFYSGTVSWVGVISSETKKLLTSKDSRFEKQPRVMPGTPEKFINNIIADKAVTRENTKNLTIFADENVATVSFDYTLYKDDKLKNWGKESWQLIYTTDGWKINAINFSYTVNPEWLSSKM